MRAPRLRPRTLRGRVTVAAALAIVLAIALLGAATIELVARQLRTSLDDSLRDGATSIAVLSATAPGVLAAPGALESPIGPRRLLIQVVDRNGAIVGRSSSLGGRVLVEPEATRRAIRDGQAGFSDSHLGPDPIRLYAAPLADVGAGRAAGGAVLVAASTAEDDRTLDRLRRLVLAAAVLAAALAAIAASVLARRALRPLGRLSDAAREIERTGDASQRLPEPTSAAELGSLADTLNAMLAALERARDAERRFLSDASHELRTPLTALRGNAAYVARHGADPAVLADLETDAARLASLLDELLALAREDAATLPDEAVDLAELAHAAAEHGATVVADAPDPVRVRGDHDALARALANLVQNAERYGPEGGRITVSARLDGDRAVLAVEDEGAGLAPDEADQAFERFWRGPGSAGREGSGLGLPIVRATAERHGGRVTVDGARIGIELPALRDLSERRRTPPASHDAKESP